MNELFDIEGRWDGMGPYGRPPLMVPTNRSDDIVMPDARSRARMWLGIPDSWSATRQCRNCERTIFLHPNETDWRCIECGGPQP